MKQKNAVLLASSVAVVQPLSMFLLTGTASGDWYFARLEILRILPWGLPAALLSGINIYLVSRYWQLLKKRKKSLWGAVGGSSSSGLAMAACCAHWFVPLFSILGLTALSGFLGQYQLWLGIASIIINAGVLLYLRKQLERIKHRMNKRLLAAPLSVMILFPAFGLEKGIPYVFDKQTSRGPIITVTVEPGPLTPEKPWEFIISMGNHQIPLDQDLERNIRLISDKGEDITPKILEDQGKGSHHRQTILVFPGLQSGTGSFKLIIRDVGKMPERILEWEI